MPYASVTVSASSGPVISSPIALDWRGGKPVMWRVTVSSSLATGDFLVQYSLDDITLATYSSTNYPPTGVVAGLPSSVGTWAAVSSYSYGSGNVVMGSSTGGAAALHFTSSVIFPDGILGTMFPPPAALRLSSTGTSSSVLRLTILQGEGG
jgi:hypothetical protein